MNWFNLNRTSGLSQDWGYGSRADEQFSHGKMAMSYETISATQDGPSCVVTLNRPDKRNAISTLMMEELIAALKSAEAEPSVRGVVITGGPAFFAAGADLNEALQVKTASQGTDYFKRWHRLNSTIEELGKPVIAAIEGFCITGGLELALACDLRVAAEGSTFAITSARIGTVAGAGGTQRLPRIVGVAHALDILFAADPIDAAHAYRIGLINRLTPKGGALDAARALVEIYAQRAPLSLAFVKRAVHRGMQMDLASAIELETSIVTTIYGTEDKQEGISAFLEKRPARFKGK
jgi:enoyl-CoA hydratase/carnithine racemase